MNSEEVHRILQSSFGRSFEITRLSPVSGGCISNAFRVEAGNDVFFLKTNDPTKLDMFEKEAKGLVLLGANTSLRVPNVISTGRSDGSAYILMEWIASGARKKDFFYSFGESLAEMHNCTSGKYGLDHDNYIGALPQYNDQKSDWLDFFISQRLQKQIEMSDLEEGVINKFERLYDKLPALLVDYGDSLLHGDLWSGNFMVSESGHAALIDPAIYYGNREAELAFTQMFGGFDSEFYKAYFSSSNLEPGFADRAELYNLYPLLVHYNLFGGGYLNSIRMTLDRFL